VRFWRSSPAADVKTSSVQEAAEHRMDKVSSMFGDQWQQSWDRTWRRAERTRDAVKERFVSDWGLELPDSIFRFHAFFEAIGPDARNESRTFGIFPYGITGLLDISPTDLNGDVDPRIYQRNDRDPPEFLGFMVGGTDGLQYGLWFDDASECTGTASYFTSTSTGLTLSTATPLEALRLEIENRCRWVEDDEDDEDRDLVLGWAAGLRERLMTVETGDRPETGGAYEDAYDHQPPAVEWLRKETLDGAGALVPARSTVTRPMMGASGSTWDEEAWRVVLAGPRDVVDGYVREARERCAADDPGHALLLGRDLHWHRVIDTSHTQDARDLLLMAYRAMGQRYLADVVEAQYRHPDLNSHNVPQHIGP
jgi:hypothetical protein